MPFPNHERKVFKTNTIESMIIQFRFSPILRIQTEIPAKFQDKIIKEFPNYQRQDVNEHIVDINNNLQGNNISSNIIPNTKHIFSNPDNGTAIVLEKTFLSFESRSYTNWEECLSCFLIGLQALLAEYTPAAFSRIGLRYTNLYQKSKLNLENIEWSKLFCKEIIGWLGADEKIREATRKFSSTAEIQLDDDLSFARVSSKLVKKDEEPCLVLDSDFYFNGILKDKEEALDKLVFLHTRSTNLLHFELSEQLKKALDLEN